jgi:large subunit ribosomal protein L9
MEGAGFNVARSQIALHQPLKMVGMHDVRITLHPEVDTRVTINVARSEDEAARQARGEDVTVARDLDEEEAEVAAPAEGEQPEEATAEAAEGEPAQA